MKYNITKPFDSSVFETMIGYASADKSKLKGIIDFEIARQLNENYFIVPVFYAQGATMVMAHLDEKFVTDYMKEAEDAKDNAVKYITQNYPNKKIVVTAIRGAMNFNSNCFYNILSYKIEFL